LAGPSLGLARAWQILFGARPRPGSRGARGRAQHFLKTGSRVPWAPPPAALAEVHAVDQGELARRLVGLKFLVSADSVAVGGSGLLLEGQSGSRVTNATVIQCLPHRPSIAAARIPHDLVGFEFLVLSVDWFCGAVLVDRIRAQQAASAARWPATQLMAPTGEQLWRSTVPYQRFIRG